MKRLLANPTVRGLALIAVVAAVIVAFSLEPVLATVGGLLRIAFFLAIAFFLFLVWRDRRSDIEMWGDRPKRVFYSAIALAVLDLGMLIGLDRTGRESVAAVVVLGGCAYAGWRVWRDQHRYV